MSIIAQRKEQNFFYLALFLHGQVQKVARLPIRIDNCRALSSARCEGFLRLPMVVLSMIRGTCAHVRAISAQHSGHLPPTPTHETDLERFLTPSVAIIKPFLSSPW